MHRGTSADGEVERGGPSPPLDRRTIFAYAAGAVSNGVKLRGMSGFLMLFYTQVVGLPAAWVGAALMAALVVDGIADPAVGLMSDNTSTRLGRRHPYMYASALPYALAFYMVWNPPAGWSDGALLAYMAATVIAVRLFDSLFEVPTAALLPELTYDYNRRTEIVSYRYLMGALGGLLMTLYAYKVIFRKDAGNPEGMLSVAGYHTYGTIAATIIFISVIVAAAGTHQRIRWLHQAPARKLQLRTIVREVLSTLSARELWILTAAGGFAAVASGVAEGLALYFQIYFWELTPAQLAILVSARLVGAIVAIPLAPWLCRRMGKRWPAGLAFALVVAFNAIPISLRLLGLLPPNGAALLIQILAAETVIHAALMVIGNIALTSMFNDLAEVSQMRTGRRSEGLLNSADNFLRKLSDGAGLFVAGLIITAVALPAKAKPGVVDPAVLTHLALVYLPTLVVLYALAIVSLSFYKLTQANHEANLRAIQDTISRGA